jgi:C4-dicarboxylate-binding protein DctP
MTVTAPLLTRRHALIGAALAAPAIRRARADEPLRLRCSLDTAPSHGRNVSMTDYLQKLEQATGGRIKGEVFPSGQLYPDLEVGKALIQGQVEMACPGSWTITGIVADADMFQLPILYGRSLDDVHTLIDGAVGAKVNDDIHQKLRAQVIGNWLDLGYQNWYSTSRPIASLADLRGMKIRNSGGAGQAWRARFVGAIPNTTAWPNVPLALSQGTFDGLVSTNISCASAKLWEAGVRHAYEDRQFIGEYVPLVADAFWAKLPPDLQQLMTDTWEQNIGAYRASTVKGQRDARAEMEKNGVVYVDASAAEIERARQAMMAEQDAMAREIKVSPEMVKLVMHDMGVSA